MQIDVGEQLKCLTAVGFSRPNYVPHNSFGSIAIDNGHVRCALVCYYVHFCAPTRGYVVADLMERP